MITPTGRAVLMLAAGALVAGVAGAVAPAFWPVGIAWALAVLLLVVVDGALTGRPGAVDARVPDRAEVGADLDLAARVPVQGRRGPQRLTIVARIDERFAGDGARRFVLDRDMAERDISYAGHTTLRPARRGTATVGPWWTRLTGPLGLAWRQRVDPRTDSVAVLPNIAAVRSPTVRIFLRDSMLGLLARRFRGDGNEFEALAEYRPGMDRRRIDWKGSARHTTLLAKEYETERNNQIVFALDAGSAMCEPIDGLPRIDRAVSAALLTGYVALKGGDQVALFGFAARPELATPFLSGSRQFARLQEQAATLDYHHEESNYTLAMSMLAGRLKRRSLIVVFTDFTDPTAADLMVEAAARMIDRHLMLFVVLADTELEGFIGAVPESADDVAKAVTAERLLDQKKLVVARLRRLGIDVIEAAHEDMGMRVIDRYLAIKRRGAI